MNKAKLTALCHKIAKESGLTFNSVMTYYFLEQILKRLSRSNYSNNYIFKGGFLLSNIIGVKSRSTIDIDFLFHQMTLSEENVTSQLEEILSKDTENISFTLVKLETIKEIDAYGGFRATISCRLENIQQKIHLDIATGDIVTPEPKQYNYHAIFENSHYQILSYNIETIIAEKLQTIVSRNFLNTRSKDFYDIYILSKLKTGQINFQQLKQACKQTFSYRQTPLHFGEIQSLLIEMNADQVLEQQWKNYSKKNTYTKDIYFQEIIKEIQHLITKIENVVT